MKFGVLRDKFKLKKFQSLYLHFNIGLGILRAKLKGTCSSISGVSAVCSGHGPNSPGHRVHESVNPSFGDVVPLFY